MSTDDSNTGNDSILRRRMTPWTARRTYFSKALVWASEHRTAPAPLSDILDHAAGRGYAQILLTGGHNAAHTPERGYWMQPTTAATGGWSIERYVPDPRSCIYVRNSIDKTRITVRMSAAWYGDCQDTTLIERAHGRLDAMLKASFDKGAILFGTPSRTGQDLLLRSLPERKDVDPRTGRKRPYEYLPAPAEVRDILTHNFGQGRMEFLQRPDAPPLRDMYLLDARWMYAAHCRGLPSLVAGGPPLVYDDLPDFEDYRPGFYRVTFRAPEDWPHIGLLPVWDASEHRTSWPVDSYFWRMGWATEPEVRLARRQGWDVRIRERILFAPDGTPGADPARQWIEKLVQLRTALQTEQTPESPLLAAALRAIQVAAVGAWDRSAKRELHVTLPGQEREIPDDAEDVTPIYANPARPTPATLQRIEWYSRAGLDAMQSAMYRPEWSIAVWGSSRRALAEEALRYPRDWEIALRSDALALRRPPSLMAQGGDDGKPGRFRLKHDWHWPAPVTVPHDETSWRKLTGGEE